MHHYIDKRTCELLISNSRLLIHNLLNLLYYADIKESCLFVAKIVEIHACNNSQNI